MPGNRNAQHPLPPTDPAEIPAASRHVVLPKNQETKTESRARQPIGEILREARLSRREDLYQIAEYLRIKPSFLIALENSHYDELPADAYVIGFLRTYANFLGLDGKNAVDLYRYEMEGRRRKPVLSMPTPVSEGRTPSALVMISAGVVLLLVYALWYGISSTNRTGDSVPLSPLVLSATPEVGTVATGSTTPIEPTPETPTAVEAPAQPTAPAVTSTGIAVTAAPPVLALAPSDKNDKPKVPVIAEPTTRLMIRATDNSWVMITDASGHTLFDHVMKPGEVYKVPNTPGLRLTTGNGSAITLSLDGTDLPRISNGAPHVVRNIPLDPDRLTAGSSASDH